MSATGYNEMLEKYRDLDEDEIMSGLTKDELARLENEIDREILEKPPECASGDSESYTTASSSSDESDENTKEKVIEEEDEDVQDCKPIPKPLAPTRRKSDAFARGKLDKTQLKPVQKSLQRQKSKDKHTFKVPKLRKTAGLKSDKTNDSDDGSNALKNELIQAVKKREGKRRVKRGNSSGVNRRPSVVASKARRNSRVTRYRDGNEHQVDAAVVNRNFITEELLNLRPRLKKVQVKEPKLVLPEELHGVSFDRITAGAKRKEGEGEYETEDEPEPAISEDGDASRNSTFGYDADADVTPSDDSYLPGEDDNPPRRHKAISESSEAPSENVITMASTASTSAESCDVFAGELSINPTSVEEMVERVKENDPTLVEVNLNNIHDVPIERFEELAEAMIGNTCVTSLLLANTGLTDRAAKALASMLKKNKTLKKLNVESNFITGDGGRRLVSALRKNNCLTELSLDNQRHIFGAKAEQDMSKMLKENTSLLKLGYQFANPGLRMATSNILTKNMDIVRRKRVAEEKKKQQSGQGKRPQLRRQPSSEWYRKERLEKLKKLQEQSRLLGLDTAKGIGDKDVEKVLKNMSQEEVSLLELWFTSKLLGMVEKPPTVKEAGREDNRGTDKGSAENKSRKAVKPTKSENKAAAANSSENKLLNLPSRGRRSKSPVASRDDLLDSIRKNNTRLKKVQLRPFESPSRIGNTDSEAENQPTLQKEATKKQIANLRQPSIATANANEGSKDLSGAQEKSLHEARRSVKNHKPSNLGKFSEIHGQSLPPDRSSNENTSSKELNSQCESSNDAGISTSSSSAKTKISSPSQEKTLSKLESKMTSSRGDAKKSSPSKLKTKATITTAAPQNTSANVTAVAQPRIHAVQQSAGNSRPAEQLSREKQSCNAKNDGNNRKPIVDRSSSPEVQEWQEGVEYDSDEYEVVEIEVTDTEESEQEDNFTTGITQSAKPNNSPPRKSEETPTEPNRLHKLKPPSFSRNPTVPSSPATLSQDMLKSHPQSSKSPSSLTTPHSLKSPPRSFKSPTSHLGGRNPSPSSSAASPLSTKSSPRYQRPRKNISREGSPATEVNPNALSTIESFFNFK